MTTSFERGKNGTTGRADFLPHNKSNSYSVTDFDGTVTKTAINLAKNGKSLSSVKAPELVGSVYSSDLGSSPVIKAKCSDGGVTVMRIGRSIYAKDESGNVSRVAANCFTGDKTVIFHIGNTFYATDKTRLLYVTDEMEYGVASPDTPVIYEFTEGNETPSSYKNEPNALSDCVDFSYTLSETLTILYIPANVKAVSAVSITYSSGTPYSGYFELRTQLNVTFVTIPDGITGSFKVRLRLGYSDDENVLSLNTFSDIRTVLYGASFSEVLYPHIGERETSLCLCDGDGNVSVIGISNGLYSEKGDISMSYVGFSPTALIGYSGGVLIFGKSKIVLEKMAGQSVSEISFETSVIKSDLGCDMPWSAVGFDDRIFFGNTENGIFYLNKFGFSEKDGSCIVSNAINDELLSHTKSELENAVSVCTAGAYYVAVGDDVYVWHYDEALPSSPSESVKTREKYNWSRIDAVAVGGYAGTSGEKVCFIEKNSGGVYLYDGGKFYDGDISSVFESKRLDFGSVHEKYLLSLVLSAEISDDAEIKISFDGVGAKSSYTVNAANADGIISYIIRPERHKFRSVSVKITSDSPITIFGIEFVYCMAGI